MFTSLLSFTTYNLRSCTAAEIIPFCTCSCAA